MARTRLIVTTLVVFLLLSVGLFAQSAPSPKISSLTPNAVSAGGPDFILRVDGSEYFSTSVVRWDDLFLSTMFINPDRLAAIVTADLIAKPGFAMVTVVDQELQTISNTVTVDAFRHERRLVTATPFRFSHGLGLDDFQERSPDACSTC